MTIKYCYGYKWLRIFHHNVAGGYFTKEEDLNIRSEHKFSILLKLEKYRINESFTFLLEYPEYQGYLSCVQSSNPVTSTVVKGFKLLHNTWSDGYGFSGFALNGGSSTLIDGSPDSYWFYAIGQHVKWSFGELAGAYKLGGKITQFKIVDLWVRYEGIDHTHNVCHKKRLLIVLIYNIILIRNKQKN